MMYKKYVLFEFSYHKNIVIFYVTFIFITTIVEFKKIVVENGKEKRLRNMKELPIH